MFFRRAKAISRTVRAVLSIMPASKHFDPNVWRTTRRQKTHRALIRKMRWLSVFVVVVVLLGTADAEKGKNPRDGSRKPTTSARAMQMTNKKTPPTLVSSSVTSYTMSRLVKTLVNQTTQLETTTMGGETLNKSVTLASRNPGVTNVTYSAPTAYTPSLKSSNISILNLIRDRIVGGRSIDITVLPYQCSLRLDGEHICGATIINPVWALSAAHCVADTLASQLSLQVGSSTITDDSQGQIHQVERLISHAQYNMYTTENDICALKVVEEFKFSSKVKALLLPDMYDTVMDYTYCTISGWGYTQEDGVTSPVLQVVLLPIIPSQICQEIYGPGVIKPSMLCAGIAEGGQDACQGDSGGPMQCQGKLVGIVSWGEGCARKGFPGVYTRISALRPWIDQTTSYGQRTELSTTHKRKKGRQIRSLNETSTISYSLEYLTKQMSN